MSFDKKVTVHFVGGGSIECRLTGPEEGPNGEMVWTTDTRFLRSRVSHATGQEALPKGHVIDILLFDEGGSLCEECEWTDVTTFGDEHRVVVLSKPCPDHSMPGQDQLFGSMPCMACGDASAVVGQPFCILCRVLRAEGKG